MKRIVILGAGESGAGAAVLAKVKGFETFVSDMSAIRTNIRNFSTAIRLPGKKDTIPKSSF